MAYLQSLKDSLVGAYIHGSLGTYEEIGYSDFDALIIVKSGVVHSLERLVRIAMRLSAARVIMFDFDPLQHHGWFVLSELDLDHYPEHYFPTELFKYAKSLFLDQGLELTVKVQSSEETSLEAFSALSNSIVRRMEARDHPKNMFELKSLLSRFMLLPALYVKVRDKKSIYKKFSFEAARVDFSHADWSIMDQVSTFRENWLCTMSSWRRWLMARPKPIPRFLARKYAPAIPDSLRERLTDRFYAKMKHLAASMQGKLR